MKSGLEGLAGPAQLDLQHLADTVRAERSQHRLRSANGLAIEAHEDISLMNVSRGPRTLGVHADDHDAGAAALDRHRLQAETQVAARDATVALEPRRDATDRGRGYHQNPPPWSKHQHAEWLPCGVDRETALSR